MMGVWEKGRTDMYYEIHDIDGEHEGAVCDVCDQWQEPDGPDIAVADIVRWSVRPGNEWDGAWYVCARHLAEHLKEHPA